MFKVASLITEWRPFQLAMSYASFIRGESLTAWVAIGGDGDGRGSDTV